MSLNFGSVTPFSGPLANSDPLKKASCVNFIDKYPSLFINSMDIGKL